MENHINIDEEGAISQRGNPFFSLNIKKGSITSIARKDQEDLTW
jgi:hypothetical protein